MKKVKIELRPYDALSILKFLREFINDDVKGDNRFCAISEAVKAYEDEIYLKTTREMLNDAMLENNINYLTNRCPPKEHY